MQDRTSLWLAPLAAILLCLSGGIGAHGQASSGAFLETINQAPTVTQFRPPSGQILPGQNVTLTGLVHSGLSTTGIQPPTQTVSFAVGGNNVGSATVQPASATNLLSYSEAFAQWTPVSNGASAPTIADASVIGPWNNGNTASAITFPATPGSAASGVSTVVSGTSYADQQLSFSVWTQATTPSSLTLIITDGSGGDALDPIMIPVGTLWQRFETTVTMPASAASGVTVTLEATGNAAGMTVDLQGAQLEAASAPGVYVATSGSSVTGLGGIATLSYAYSVGPQTTVATYIGDVNYLGSTSPTVSTTTDKATASIALVSSLNPSIYGQPVTFTATITGDGSPFATGGVVTIRYGGTVIGTCNATVGTSPFICTGTTNALPTGTDNIVATYAGDPNYNDATSNTVAQVVNVSTATVNMTLQPNPAVYGHPVTFIITVTGVSGLAIPSGTVTVVDNGSCTSSCTGGTNLGGGPLTLTNGATSFSNATLTGGPHNLIVTYDGDASYR